MIWQFIGETADDVWQKIAHSFRGGEGWTLRDGRGGPIRELLHAVLSIERPSERWVVSRTPGLNPGFALAEVVWIVAGRNDSKFMNGFFPGLPQYQGTGRTFYGAYGYRLRKHFGLDQLEQAYVALRENCDTRQVVLQLWDPRLDMPDEYGRPRSDDIPCNILAMLKIRNGCLDWTQIIRSNDVWRGLPHNLVQFTSLQEIMAGWLGCKLGTYCQMSDSLHVYMDDEDANNLRSSTPIEVVPNPDSLALPKSESEEFFRELAARVDRMVGNELGEKDIVRLAQFRDAPASIQNT